MKHALLLASLGLAVASVAPNVSATVIDFDVASDYQNNFWSPTGLTATTWNSGGYLAKTSATTTVAVYNTDSTGASGNYAGTAGGTPLDKFGSFTIQADFYADGLGGGGNSIGFYTKVNDAANSGYLAVFRLSDSGSGTPSADLRIWGGVNPSTGGVNTALSTQTFALTSGNFFQGTFYTVKLDVRDVGSDVEFTASIWTTATTPAQIGSTISYTHLNGVTGEGQVGIRLGSANNPIRMDNFSITAIPEPSTYALLGGAGALGLALVQRRKRR